LNRVFLAVQFCHLLFILIGYSWSNLTKEKTMFKPTRTLTLTLALGLLLSLALAACGSQPAATSAPAQPQAAAATNAPAATSAPATAETVATEAPAAQPAAAGAVSYSKDLQPIFQESCVSCHGGERTSRALDLKTFESLMAGSQNGAVIVPGQADASKLVQAIQSGKMPKRGTKWTPEQLKLLVDWVNAGAQNN
jgi:uncharacterized membrane protein